MAHEATLKFGADVIGAVSALGQLKQAVAAVSDPAGQLKSAFTDANAALQGLGDTAAAQRRADVAALAAFKANMQIMVDARRLSVQQAIGFEMEYSGQLQSQERARLEAALETDSATVASRLDAYGKLAALGATYSAQSAQQQRRLADAAGREAARIALPFRQAFDEIGGGLQSALAGLVEGAETYRSAALRVVQSIERSVVGLGMSIASKAAAGPLGSLLGVGAQPGEGVGDVLGTALSRSVFGMPQQLGQSAAVVANTTALAANTSAVAALTATLGVGVSAVGAEAGIGAGAIGAAGGAAEGAAGGGLFGGLFSLLGFARGGIVPSASRGWALPRFVGATPALLHSREMVLPAPISEGLQEMIGRGGGNDAHFHAHFHGPADAPAISRWFRDNVRANAGAVRDIFRSNALTPRSL